MVRKDGGWGSPRHPSEFAPSLKHLLVKTYLVCMFWLHLFSWQKIQIWSSLVEKKSLSSAPISTEVSTVNMTLSNVSLDRSASNDHCTLQSLFLWLISWQYCNVLVHQPKALRTLDMYEVVTLTSKTRNSLFTKAGEVNSLLWRSHMSTHLLWKSVNFLGIMLSRRVAGARTPVLLYRFTNLKIDCSCCYIVFTM